MEANDLNPDPFALFESWFQEATTRGAPQPEATALATATPDGRPSVRMVLLKGVDPNGFSFFTNYESRKAGELDANPRAAMTFYWHVLEKQVRIEGVVARTTAAESDAYYATRPYGSRIGAWASPQSRPVPDREVLVAKTRELEARFPESGVVPRPPFWGGYKIVPATIEFWIGRTSRLHDRFVYTRTSSGWSRTRLGP